MTHFEYISVATALVIALAVGRLLTGISPAADESRRYWVHLGWIAVLILACVSQWWALWSMRDVDWTPFRFAWLLSMPAMLFVMATVLIGEEPARTTSFREHYFERRARFFSLGLASAGLVGLSPWVLGLVPWFTLAGFQPAAIVMAMTSAVGLASRRPGVHAALAVISLFLSVSGFVASPT